MNFGIQFKDHCYNLALYLCKLSKEKSNRYQSMQDSPCDPYAPTANNYPPLSLTSWSWADAYGSNYPWWCGGASPSRTRTKCSNSVTSPNGASASVSQNTTLLETFHLQKLATALHSDFKHNYLMHRSLTLGHSQYGINTVSSLFWPFKACCKIIIKDISFMIFHQAIWPPYCCTRLVCCKQMMAGLGVADQRPSQSNQQQATLYPQQLNDPPRPWTPSGFWYMICHNHHISWLLL